MVINSLSSVKEEQYSKMENKLDELNKKVEARKNLKQAHYMQKLEDNHHEQHH